MLDITGDEAMELVLHALNRIADINITKQVLCVDSAGIPTVPGYFPAFLIIYNPVFLKAFFGEDLIATGTCAIFGDDISPAEIMLPEWQWHAQHMVTADDPFEYLRSFL